LKEAINTREECMPGVVQAHHIQETHHWICVLEVPSSPHTTTLASNLTFFKWNYTQLLSYMISWMQKPCSKIQYGVLRIVVP
jgi:hypothetical protein